MTKVNIFTNLKNWDKRILIQLFQKLAEDLDIDTNTTNAHPDANNSTKNETERKQKKN